MRSSTDDGSTLMLELDNKAVGVTYETAATAAVFPVNNPALVEHLAKFEGWDLDKVFVLRSASGTSMPYPFPGPTTVREALSRFCDLTGLLLKAQLRKLATFAKYPDNIEGYVAKYEHFKEQYKSIVDLIIENDIKLSFGDFVSICNRIIVLIFF